MTRRTRVLLVRHAPTPATRAGAFPAGEPLDEHGAALAEQLGRSLACDHVMSADDPACRATADRLRPSTEAVELDARWDAPAAGDWRGRSLDEVAATSPTGLARWVQDPAVAPPGGESLAQAAARSIAALADLHATDRVTAVVTSAENIAAVVLSVLGAPLSAWRNLDLAPASVTTLQGRGDGGWTLRGCNATPARSSTAHQPART